MFCWIFQLFVQSDLSFLSLTFLKRLNIYCKKTSIFQLPPKAILLQSWSSLNISCNFRWKKITDNLRFPQSWKQFFMFQVRELLTHCNRDHKRSLNPFRFSLLLFFKLTNALQDELISHHLLLNEYNFCKTFLAASLFFPNLVIIFVTIV